jgi:hypothetical protein
MTGQNIFAVRQLMRNDIPFRMLNFTETVAIWRSVISVTVLSFAENTPKEN